MANPAEAVRHTVEMFPDHHGVTNDGKGGQQRTNVDERLINGGASASPNIRK